MATFPSDSVRTKNWITEILTDADLEGQLDLLHEYLKAALNSSTGHVHDGTSNQAPKLDKASLVTDFVNDYTTVTGESTDYILIDDVSDSNATKKALASDFTFTPTAANALAGSVVQVQMYETGAATTCTTALPIDGTIPTYAEGDVVLTLAFTPTSASNKLVIEALSIGRQGTVPCGLALFKDGSGTDPAIAGVYIDTVNGYSANLYLCHTMTSPGTGTYTFKCRRGAASGNSYQNSDGTTNIFGGILTSFLKITEIKV